jgi:tetratricopeptide (TPR) repeat protein
MNWKNNIETLIAAGKWEDAIYQLGDIIAHNPDDIWAYIYIIFCLNNLFFREKNIDKVNSYEPLAHLYFKESYDKFSHNAEYLYFVGFEVGVVPHFFGSSIKQADSMVDQSVALLDSEHPIHQWLAINEKSEEEKKQYQEAIENLSSPLTIYFRSKGSVGNDVLLTMQAWLIRRKYPIERNTK